MKRSTKKGFTIVELVIVIAIIAILAAVLIPTFASLIQKANESKDTQLVRNLNTALKTDGKEHKTMQDALDAAAAFGYDVGKINASATDNEILWDSVNDAFCYYDDGNGIKYLPESNATAPADYLLWKIYDNQKDLDDDNQKYSIYWNNEAAPKLDELKVGFDAGACTTVSSLKYVGNSEEQKVVIRTKGATVLTVDAENDTIYHYGEAGNVEIVKCAPASYHVYGKVVGTISVKQGHVSVEEGALVAQPIVVKDTTGDVKVSAKEVVVVTVDASITHNVAVESEKPIYIDDTANKVTNKPSTAIVPTEIENEDSIKSNSVVDTNGNYALKAGMYKLTGNINIAKQVYVNADNKVVLDLNGYNYICSYRGVAILNYGDMTINNSSTTVGHIYTTNTEAQGTVAVQNNGNIVINNGIFGTNLDADSEEPSKVNRGGAFVNYGTAEINGGAFRSIDNGVAGYAYAIINNDGSLIINNAKIWGQMNGAIACNSGNVTIYNADVNLTGNGSYGVFYLGTVNGNINVYGGNYSKSGNNIYFAGWDIEDKNFKEITEGNALHIYGGTFTYNGKPWEGLIKKA